MTCPHGCSPDTGLIERLATPEEVDAGCELGIAFDPCPIHHGFTVDGYVHAHDLGLVPCVVCGKKHAEHGE